TYGDILSASLSSHGAEKNHQLQRDAKAAECAFCIWAGLDPLVALNWTASAESGTDVVWRGLRVDVKHTPYPRGALIWPYKKVKLFHGKHFDILVLVTGSGRNFTVARWTTKPHFALTALIADENLPAFHPGTMVLPYDQCWPTVSLATAPDWALSPYQKRAQA